MGAVSQPLQATLTNQIFDHEGKVGDLDESGSAEIRREQVDRLACTLGRTRGAAKFVQAGAIKAAISVEHDHDVGRIVAEEVSGGGERETLSPAVGVISYQHLRASKLRQRLCLIIAIVSHDKQTRTAAGCDQLFDGTPDYRLLVMRRYNNHGSRRRSPRRLRAKEEAPRRLQRRKSP